MIKPPKSLVINLLRLVLLDTVYSPDRNLFHHKVKGHLLLWSLAELVNYCPDSSSSIESRAEVSCGK